jgi:hypothetical protein
MTSHHFNPADFPSLNGNYQKTSDETKNYNCIAWAAGDSKRWWWPDHLGFYYWPKSVRREEQISAFIDAFKSLGFELCDSCAHEHGIEKVAIYALLGVPTHAARQLPSGIWTSKMGQGIDISHELNAVKGQKYGAPVVFLSRRAK